MRRWRRTASGRMRKRRLPIAEVALLLGSYLGCNSALYISLGLGNEYLVDSL